MNPNEALKKYFGYDNFRSGQIELVNSILSGRDVLGVMPTGAGKSVCYQIPALIREGISLIISPLISLMQDQVAALVQSGIKAAYINSSLTHSQLYNVINNAGNGAYKLIYVAPERLDSEAFRSFAASADITSITVDEAHCISQWGQDFRPSYLGIPAFAASLPVRPVMSAFTATATERVRKDIIRLLGLNDPFIMVTGFDRQNLYFGVRRPADKQADLKRLVKRYSDEGRSGIIYCSTRKNVERVCESLCLEGFSATRYHAGLSEAERMENQDDFIYDRKRIMVATNAFGMGIDKSNVTFVIHYNMPKDVESYYQEAGRAGRDGSPSDCIILYSGQDIITARFLINKSFEESAADPEAAEETRKRDMKRLSDMAFYCTGADCLREYILRYFGERAPAHCGNCSFCCSEEGFTDITVEAQKIMSCIFRTGQKYGQRMIGDVLRGVSSDRISSLGLDRLTTYGIMADCSEMRIKQITEKLTAMGFIEKTDGEYPVLRLAPPAVGVLKGNVPVKARLPKDSESAGKRRSAELPEGCNIDLYEELRSLRTKIAAVQGVPAYVIFSDASLRDMSAKLPQTDEEFRQVSGVGQAKLDRYGDEFMKLISDYLRRNPQKADALLSERNKQPECASRKRMTKRTANLIDGFEALILRRENIHITDEALTATAFAERVKADAALEIGVSPLRSAITGWLVNRGYLQSGKDGEGHECKKITDVSEKAGIYCEKRRASSGREYEVILYKPEAQRFILDNIEEIRSFALAGKE